MIEIDDWLNLNFAEIRRQAEVAESISQQINSGKLIWLDWFQEWMKWITFWLFERSIQALIPFMKSANHSLRQTILICLISGIWLEWRSIKLNELIHPASTNQTTINQSSFNQIKKWNSMPEIELNLLNWIELKSDWLDWLFGLMPGLITLFFTYLNTVIITLNHEFWSNEEWMMAGFGSINKLIPQVDSAIEWIKLNVFSLNSNQLAGIKLKRN